MWKQHSRGDFELALTAKYDDKVCGTANAGEVLALGDQGVLVTGHANGVVLVWTIGEGLDLVHTIDVRSQKPANPWNMFNVRDIEVVNDGIIVTGSEDGDLCIIDVRNATILSRLRYSKTAQMGINAIAYEAPFLVVANCSVGPTDNNLWLFRLDGTTLKPIASTNLKQDDTLKQAFTFSVALAPGGEGSPMFMASTQEGILWNGRVSDKGIDIQGRVAISADGGASLAYDDKHQMLAVVDHPIRVYKVSQEPSNDGVKK